MNEFAQIVSSIGFPIACCIFLLYQNAKQDNYHREEQEKLRQTLEKNTESINHLSELIKQFVK